MKDPIGKHAPSTHGTTREEGVSGRPPQRTGPRSEARGFPSDEEAGTRDHSHSQCSRGGVIKKRFKLVDDLMCLNNDYNN